MKYIIQKEINENERWDNVKCNYTKYVLYGQHTSAEIQSVQGAQLITKDAKQMNPEDRAFSLTLRKSSRFEGVYQKLT